MGRFHGQRACRQEDCDEAESCDDDHSLYAKPVGLNRAKWVRAELHAL
jgi:hypothetical protein